MEGLGAIWRSLTLGPVSIFSGLALLGMLAFFVLASRNVGFIWGVCVAAFVALARAPVVWHKRALRGDPDIVTFVASLTVATFFGVLLVWVFIGLLVRRRR